MTFTVRHGIYIYIDGPFIEIDGHNRTKKNRMVMFYGYVKNTQRVIFLRCQVILLVAFCSCATGWWPPVNSQKTMERSTIFNGKITIFNGKIHYFYGHFQ